MRVKVFEMIVTFGTVPEVPAGHRKYKRHDETLVVHSYERKSDEWDDPELIYRYLTRHELTRADTVYVYVGDVEQACATREQSWLLVRRILKDLNGRRKEVAVVTSFEGLDPEVREKENREAEQLGVRVVELKGVSAEKFFADIVRKYRPAA